MNFQYIISYVLARLSEASTWINILQFLTAAGIYHFSDSQAGTIASLGVAMTAAVGMAMKDKGADK
jgi:hypothetical protein